MDRLEDPLAPSSTERGSAEIPPEDAHAFYRGIFWAATDAILVADAAGRYLDANQGAATLLGYSPEELLHMHVQDVVASDADWTSLEYERFLHEGTWSGELELRRRDGTLVPVEAHATVVERQGGGPVYLSVIRDVSARWAAERARQEFLAMVAHELKTPLTAILGHAELMQRRASYSAEGTKIIISQVKRLRRLIDDLGEVAHFAVGQPALRRASMDLTALARESAAQAVTVTPTHLVRIEAPTQPLLGWWDGDRVAQVLQNLLANAGKYAPAGSAILIRVEARADAALVSVIDEGTGIAPEELPRLFERFYRTESATRSGAEGLGLGLHICKQLVEAHGGQIWVESALGRGTSVFFTLPYTQPPAE